MIRPLQEILNLIKEAEKENFKLLISGTEFVNYFDEINKYLKHFEVSYCCLNDNLKNEEFILCTF